MSFVYFIHCAGTNYCKIGTALNIGKRLAGLQSANPFKLQLLGFKEGDRDLEIAWHMYFKNRRVRGEWFEFRSPARALYIFMRYSMSDLFDDMNKRSNIRLAADEERRMSKFTPEIRELMERSVRRISATIPANNVRA